MWILFSGCGKTRHNTLFAFSSFGAIFFAKIDGRTGNGIVMEWHSHWHRHWNSHQHWIGIGIGLQWLDQAFASSSFLCKTSHPSPPRSALQYYLAFPNKIKSCTKTASANVTGTPTSASNDGESFFDDNYDRDHGRGYGHPDGSVGAQRRLFWVYHCAIRKRWVRMHCQALFQHCLSPTSSPRCLGGKKITGHEVQEQRADR